jgi:hypothetical protein
MENEKLPPNVVKVGMARQQLAELKSEVLLQAPYASRVSFGLLVSLVTTGDMIPLIREIDALEGLKPATNVKCKKGEQFRHPPLFPFLTQALFQLTPHSAQCRREVEHRQRPG